MIIKCFNEEVKTSNKNYDVNGSAVFSLQHFLSVLFL